MPRGHFDRNKPPFNSSVNKRATIDPPFQGGEASAFIAVGEIIGADPAFRQWNSPADPPQDHRDVMVKLEGGHEMRAKLRKTRRFANGRWCQNEFWADPLTSKPIGVKVVGWRDL